MIQPQREGGEVASVQEEDCDDGANSYNDPDGAPGLHAGPTKPSSEPLGRSDAMKERLKLHPAHSRSILPYKCRVVTARSATNGVVARMLFGCSRNRAVSKSFEFFVTKLWYFGPWK